MGVHVGRLRRLVEGFGERGQAKAARALDVSKGSLSRMLSDPETAAAVRRQTVERMERSAGLVPGTLWDGPAGSLREVSRETNPKVREPSVGYNVTLGGQADVLRAIEEMALALAKIAREAREAGQRKA